MGYAKMYHPFFSKKLENRLFFSDSDLLIAEFFNEIYVASTILTQSY